MSGLHCATGSPSPIFWKKFIIEGWRILSRYEKSIRLFLFCCTTVQEWRLAYTVKSVPYSADDGPKPGIGK